MAKPALLITMDAPAHQDAETVELRGASGEVLTQERKDELLRALRANAPDAPMRLTLSAVVFTQGDKPNAKFSRLTPRGLKKFTASAKGTPFLRDHEAWNLLSRGGTVLESKLTERNGVPAFVQRIELNEEWAIKAALNGNLDRFSVSWGAVTPPTCSVCEQTFYGADSTCTHWPGKEYGEGKARKLCEVIYDDVVAKETSGVNGPAAAGTNVETIESIHAELSAARANPPQGAHMFDKIRTALGLAASDESLGEDRLAQEITRLRDRSTEQGNVLLAERENHTATKAELAAARAALKAAEDAKVAGRVDALVERCLAEGRIFPARDKDGKKIPGAGEKAIRSFAARDYAGAEEWALSLESKVHANPEPVEGEPKGGGAVVKLSARELKVAADMGVTPEQLAATKQKKAAEAAGRE